MGLVVPFTLEKPTRLLLHKLWLRVDFNKDIHGGSLIRYTLMLNAPIQACLGIIPAIKTLANKIFSS